MIVHQVYAQIFEGEVKNVIVCDNYEMANWLSRAAYGNGAFVIDCLQCPCTIGDKYHDGTFWRENEETQEECQVDYVPTQEQQVQQLTAENEELMIVVADLIGGAGVRSEIYREISLLKR